MRHVVVSLALAGIFMLHAASASATTISTSFGFGADTHINLGSNSGKNNGDSDANGVQNVSKAANAVSDPDSPFTARAIVRFDLSGLPQGTITDAFFTFSVRFLNTFTVSMRGLVDSDLQDAAPGSGGYLENSISHDTAPSLATGFADTLGAETFTQSVGISGNGTRVTTVNDTSPTFVTFAESAGTFKSNLLNFLNADTNGLVSIMLISNASPTLTNAPGFSFWSKEGAAAGIAAAVAPTLTVTVDSAVVPVPATLPLILTSLVGLGLIGRRARKKTDCVEG